MRVKGKLRSALEVYDIVDLIGQGGTGAVYRVRDGSGKLHAAKVVDPSTTSPEKLRRFRNELFFCLKNEHPNVIRILDYGTQESKQTPSASFYVMPLYEGTLRTVMGKLDPVDVLPLYGQILDGVEAAHLLGVTHRDIKPENVLYDGPARRLVVADWGVAEFAQNQLHTLVETRPNTRLANFLYAAPEQRVRHRPVDQRADIYALGLILNEVFTAEVPHGTGYVTIGSRHAEYVFLDPLVERMVRQDPQQRYSSIDEIKKDLIARQQLHIVRQRVAEGKAKVVPETDVSDPLVLAPPGIVSFDWKDETLTFELNPPPTTRWIEIFHGLGGQSHLLGYGGPASVRFYGRHASVRARASDAHKQKQFFEQWFAGAVTEYARVVREENNRRLAQERDSLARQVANEEERQRVLMRLRGGG